ncbi:MAG: hypothetical protein WA864_11000 [Acetobacteraceae bacterium]|jgi:hypothetical protein
MTGKIDLQQLAYEIAAIASATTDPETGRLLAELVKKLLEAAGLPRDDDEEGGGEPPTQWISAPMDFFAA